MYAVFKIRSIYSHSQQDLHVYVILLFYSSLWFRNQTFESHVLNQLSLLYCSI